MSKGIVISIIDLFVIFMMASAAQPRHHYAIF